jgi:hypothetical protein
MISLCISQFDIDTTDPLGESNEDEEPTAEERQLAALTRAANLAQYTPDPINDNKEDNEDESEEQDNFNLFMVYTPTQSSQRVLGKRRRSFVSHAEEDDDDETEPQLPPISVNNEGLSQMRTYRRTRKRPKNLDDYHVRYE